MLVLLSLLLFKLKKIMQNINFKLLTLSFVLFSFFMNLNANDTIDGSTPKRTLYGNMTLKYNTLPNEVDNLYDFFTEGIFYGRLRSNSFYWKWLDENVFSNNAPKNMGLGGSIIYKSATLNHLSFTLGYYGSVSPEFWRPSREYALYSKSGKDTFSRFKLKNGGGFGMSVFAQGYAEYKNEIVNVKVGRQLFESVFTKSNDTKMIPNSFDGISTSVNITTKSKFRFAWFNAQKLRDHLHSHDVITYKDENGEKWNNNDDGGGHKGLTYENFIQANRDPNHDMYLADFRYKHIKKLDFTLSYLQIPDVLKDIVIEAHYKIPLFETDWVVRPGMRYFYQMDDGGGEVAGDTNSLGVLATSNGYSKSMANSLDSSIINARVDLLMPLNRGFFRVGYSDVADKADIISPWRGFPTSGFTRAMGQYNWFANTQTFMLRAVYRANDIFKTSVRYAVQNYDDSKDYVPSDSNIINIDTWINITKDLQMKMRYAHVDADSNTKMIHQNTHKFKTDWSYDEFRLEFNYLF